MTAWKSLRMRIVLVALSGVTLLSGAVVGVVGVLLRGELAKVYRLEVVSVIEAVTQILEHHARDSDLTEVKAITQGLAESRRVYGVVVFDRESRIVLAVPDGLRSHPLLGRPDPSAGARAISDGDRSLEAHFTRLEVAGNTAAGFWLVVDREPFEAATRRFVVFALLLVLAVLGLSMVLVTLAAERLVRPMEELSDTLGALARGDVEVRHEVHGAEEFQRLARRVNRVAEQLESSRAGVARLAGDIDRQVRERTHEYEETNRRLAELANSDPLTGTTNRRGLEIELERYLSLSRRNRQPLALIMLDLDNFKTYNDACGHLAGDTVLRTVAAALRGRARASDVVARWGGDEFCILVPATGCDGAQAAAASFVAAVHEAMRDLSRPDVRAVLGASAGVSCFPDDGEEGVELIARADAALYRAKAHGGGAVVRAG